MHENKPRLPSHEELREIHEEAPPRQPPNHKPTRLNYEELKSSEPATGREGEEFRSHPEQVNRTDAIEAEIAAYQKDLDARVEAGNITPRERTYLMTRYDQLQASILKSPDEVGAIRGCPEPANENTEQEKGEDRESVKRPDWKLMMIDPTFRRKVEKQLQDERAAIIHEMKMAQEIEPQ